MTTEILIGNATDLLKGLASDSVHCCVTSPPYYNLRDYQHAGQIGAEKSLEDYVDALVAVFAEVKRVLRPDGTLWVNLGDTYVGGSGYWPNSPSNRSGSKQSSHRGSMFGGVKPQGDLKAKDLIGVPWQVAFALRADRWYLRQDLIWYKPNPMPERVRDRCTKSHEYLFLFSKKEIYHYDYDAVQEMTSDGQGRRNRHSVWTIAKSGYKGSHFATFPPDLIEPCIRAGCPAGGTVLDPFAGSGTTGMVANQLGRNSILIEINPEYAELARQRTAEVSQFGRYFGSNIPA